jgi:tetratricopeptide (TPR) repeat protein
MNRYKKLFFIVLTLLLSFAQAAAQETFRNPAMETQDEAQQAINNARALARKGQFEEAIKEIKKAAGLRNDQCAECFQFIGQTCFQMGKFKDAAAAFRQAIALKPANEAELYNGLGVALYVQKDKKALEESVPAFKRSIELSKGKVVKAYYNLGHALIKLDKKEEGVEAFKAFLAADPASNNAEEVRAIIANPRLAGEQFAPRFAVKATTGDELSLDKLKGKVVLLDFWASWCGPCRVEMPEVKNIWKKYKDDQFIIIGVNLDENDKAFNSYVKREELTWPQYYDGRGWNNALSRLYQVHSIPHTVLIDQRGIVRAVGLRGSKLSSKIGEMLKDLQKQETIAK